MIKPVAVSSVLRPLILSCMLLFLCGCHQEDTPDRNIPRQAASPALVDKQMQNMHNTDNLSPEAKAMIERQARSAQSPK